MLSSSLMKFRPDPEKISPLFLFCYFGSDTGRAEIMRFSSQVGTPGIGQPLTSLRVGPILWSDWEAEWEAGGVSDRVMLGARDELAARHSVASASGATLSVGVGAMEGWTPVIGWSPGGGV